MEVTLYKNSSENNVIGKTLTQIKSVEANLKNDVSVINPTFILYYTDNILQSNYCFIPKFNRYYFISDISSVANHLWRITSTVDVLMSYKDQILETNAFVARNQNEFNKDIIDNECVLTDKEEVEITEVAVELFNDEPQSPYVLTMIADY